MTRLFIAVSALLPLAAVWMPNAQPEPELEWKSERGYLDSLLRKYNISKESQVLVWSKSSLQSDPITRKTPRAIYFNEETYVGWIPGAPLIEVMKVDPRTGPEFFSLENVRPMAKPALQREDRKCFPCHGGRVEGVASSLLVRSSHVAESGYPRAFVRSLEVTPRTPISQRWGGWYVTGQHGTMRHMGNVVSTGTDQKPVLDTAKGANVTSLAKWTNLKGYPSAHSDIVALMVLEQQMYVQNIISQTGLDLAGQAKPLASDVEPLVRALLGSGEAKLTSPVSGTSSFAKHYSSRGPLYQLDLKTRLQKYPCSPLIYSESFRALPVGTREQVWRRFEQILVKGENNQFFAHLNDRDRVALHAVLTKTLPEYARFVRGD